MRFKIFRKDVHTELDGGLNPDDYETVHKSTEIFVIPENEMDEFGEFIASDCGDTDYAYQPSYKEVGDFDESEIEEIYKIYSQEKLKQILIERGIIIEKKTVQVN